MNFIDLATKIIMGIDVPRIDKSCFELDYVGVKAPQFSFTRIKGAKGSSDLFKNSKELKIRKRMAKKFIES